MLSERSITSMGAALAPAFADYVASTRFDELGELFATAADEFLTQELGQVDDEVMARLMLELIQQLIVVEASAL